MAGVPIVYRDTRERVLANYNFIDIASGTGYVVFQGFQTTTDSETTYHLSANAINSRPNYLYFVGTGDIQTTTYDFDTSPFNLPRVIKGIMSINWNQIIYNDNSPNTWMYVTIEPFKWDGVTETSLASSKRNEEFNQPGGGNYARMENLTFDISETNFKKGDMLRIRVATTFKSGGSEKGRFYICTNPQNISQQANIDLTKGNMYFKVAVPFKIDL